VQRIDGSASAKADFAAVQSIARVGGLNMKGLFTRTRQPKMAAHVLREFWAKR
jgi:beta-glucuronidase